MKSLFWLLGLAVLAVALTLATHNPGYVLLFYPPYRAEMPLSLFVVAMLLAFMVIYLALRLFFATARLPQQVRTIRNERAQEKGRKALLQALTAFFEERYASAEQSAAEAMTLLDDSGLSAIVAARAAHESGEYSKRDAYLEKAGSSPASGTAMRLISAAKFNIDQHRPQQALDAVEEMRRSGLQGHTGSLRTELRAQRLAGNWDAVLDVSSRLEKLGALDRDTAEQMRRQAWLEKIRSCAQDLPALNKAWGNLPRDYRLASNISATAARAFIRLGEPVMASEIITGCLMVKWDSALSAIYGDCLCDDVHSQIEQAERWLQSHGNDAGLLLALGKLCLHQKLWDKAQGYLAASASIDPCLEAYRELGRLADISHKPEDALRYYRQALVKEDQ